VHPKVETDDRGWEVFLTDSLSPRTHRQKILLLVVSAYTLLAAVFDEQPLSLLHLGGVTREHALGAVAVLLIYLSVSYLFYLRQDLLSWYSVKTAFIGAKARDCLSEILQAEQSIISSYDGFSEKINEWESKMEETYFQLTIQIENCERAISEENQHWEKIVEYVDKHHERARLKGLDSLPEQWNQNFSIQNKIISGAQEQIDVSLKKLKDLDKATCNQRVTKWLGIIGFEIIVPFSLVYLALMRTAQYVPGLLEKVLFL